MEARYRPLRVAGFRLLPQAVELSVENSTLEFAQR